MTTTTGRAMDLAAATRVVQSPAAPDDIAMYFRGENGGRPWNGCRFESLGGGGDQSGVADVVTPTDLVAVSLLDVTIPGDVTLDLLESELGQQVSALLRQIPTDVGLHEAAAAGLIADGSPADQLYALLRKRHDMGPTKTSKLLARKRPHLIPIRDSVVSQLLGEPDAWWRPLHEALASDALGIRSSLEELRTAAALPQISLLRVLDVALWMSARPKPAHV